MIEFTLTNNRCSVRGDLKTLNEAYKEFSVRHPNAWFLRKHMPKGWDGKIHYLTESGTFNGGIFQNLYNFFKEKGQSIKVIDNRINQNFKLKKVKDLKGLVPRDYQIECVDSLINNYLGETWWPRGIFKEATNAGKTIISALLYRRLGKPKTLLIINSTELFEQALQELPELIDKEEIGYIEPNKIVWNNFMICKVKTMANRMDSPQIKSKINEYQVCIVDECDLADNVTYKSILRQLVGLPVKVGMSGTVYVSKLAKDKIKNENIRAFFGNQLHEITNKELMDKGHSSIVEATFFLGNTKIDSPGDIDTEVEKGITKSKERNTAIVNRVSWNLDNKRYPILIVCKHKKHVKILHKRLQAKFGNQYKIDWVYHDRPDRARVVEEFRVGELDILVGSGILKRGKNFKHMMVLINAGGGKGAENFLQILGRAFRNGRQGRKWYEDFFDYGTYLKKHSRRRIINAKNEKIKVIENYKNG